MCSTVLFMPIPGEAWGKHVLPSGNICWSHCLQWWAASCLPARGRCTSCLGNARDLLSHCITTPHTSGMQLSWSLMQCWMSTEHTYLPQPAWRTNLEEANSIQDMKEQSCMPALLPLSLGTAWSPSLAEWRPWTQPQGHLEAKLQPSCSLEQHYTSWLSWQAPKVRAISVQQLWFFE